MLCVFVVGASGMTGRSLVEQLLAQGNQVRAMVRSTSSFIDLVGEHPSLECIEASILKVEHEELAEHVKGCGAVVSCLGHNITFKGLFGEPKRLCTDAVAMLHRAIEANAADITVKFILMSTVGVSNPDLVEQRSMFDRCLLFLLRHTLPPHRDNETAAFYVRNQIGRNCRHLAWSCVRPDSLINAAQSPYEIEPSPVTGITSGRPTARANVAHFMMTMIEDEEVWDRWKYCMPVIMNREA